jgi:deoxyribonuclease V
MEDEFILKAPEEFRSRLIASRDEQKLMADWIDLENRVQLGDVRLVAGFDTAYDEENNLACAGVVVVDFRTLETIEEHISYFTPEIPYIPSFLHLRESKGYHSVYKKIDEKPNVSIFDGNGILHPYKTGLATLMGLELKIPTIGVAKKLFMGDYEQPLKKGGYSDIFLDDEIIGVAFQSKDPPAKPIFLSPGHFIDFSLTINIIREFILNQTYQTKLPLPLFRVDQLVKEHLKKE